MALRFNPPPNWPTPPEGFVPQPGWQPDPAWGPAPEGWQFWLEEEDDATRVLPTDQVEEKAADVAETPEPISATEEPKAAEEAVEPTSAPPAKSEEDPTEVFSSSEEPTRPLNPYAREIGTYTAASTNQAPYQQGAQQSTYQQGAPSPNAAAQDPAAAAATQAPTQKKSNKVLWIVLGGLLVFLLIIVLLVSLIVGLAGGGSSSETANDTSISQKDAGSDTWNDSSDSSSGSYSRESTGGKAVTYEGQGDKTIDIEKPGGENSTAWVEYSFEPDDQYTTFHVDALDSKGDTNAPIANVYGELKNTVTGSSFLDGHYSHKEPTEKFDIRGEGKWKIVVHPISDAPVKKAGDTINGTASQAFIIDSSSDSTADIKVENGSNAGAHFSITKLPDELGNDPIIDLFETGYPGYKGTVTLPNGEHLYQVESWTGLKWEIKLD